MPDAIEGEHLPTRVGYEDKLQAGRDPGEDDKLADEPFSDGLHRNSVVSKPTVASAGIIAQVKKQDVEVLDWRGDTWLCQRYAA